MRVHGTHARARQSQMHQTREKNRLLSELLWKRGCGGKKLTRHFQPREESRRYFSYSYDARGRDPDTRRSSLTVEETIKRCKVPRREKLVCLIPIKPTEYYLR